WWWPTWSGRPWVSFRDVDEEAVHARVAGGYGVEGRRPRVVLLSPTILPGSALGNEVAEHGGTRADRPHRAPTEGPDRCRGPSSGWPRPRQHGRPGGSFLQFRGRVPRDGPRVRWPGPTVSDGGIVAGRVHHRCRLRVPPSP